jgi:exosortase
MIVYIGLSGVVNLIVIKRVYAVVSQAVLSTSAPVMLAGRRPSSESIPSLVVTIVVLAVAHLPLLVLEGRILWAREHYHFFPLLILAAAVLAYRNLRGQGSFEGGRKGPSALFWWIALLFLAVAVLSLSPWLGAVAAQMSLLAASYAIGGRRFVQCLMPAWLLLWLAIPLPGALDDKLVSGLQRISTARASDVLETIGVMHLREGNVLDLGGRRILVEEACSGIHSLFSTLACAFFWAAWNRRSWATRCA